MNAAGEGRARALVGGGAKVLAADALQLPAAVLLGAYLGRRLGAEGLVVYLLAAAVVTWVELVVSALFSRAAVQMVAESDDWQPVASLVLRWHAGIGCVAAALLVIFVLPFEEPLAVPGLRRALLLFALEIPLFALARSHTHVLVGLGRYRERAIAGAVRWTSRLALSVAFVALGFGVDGAVLGAVLSTALELAAARAAVRPSLVLPTSAALASRLLRLSAPLFAHGIALQLFHRLGLLLLVPLGVTVSAAGAYGAADSLLRLRRVLGQSLTPLVLATLAGLRRDGAEEEARRLGLQALRLTIYSLVPVAAVAGAAEPLMRWIFGAEFADGGAILALLVWGAPAFLVLSIASAILVAAGRPGVVAALSAPMVPAALVSYAIVVPRLGAAGVAAATSAIAVATAGAALVMACRVAGIALPFRTAIRTMLGAAVAFAAARGSLLVADGVLWLLAALTVAVAAGVGAALALGEARPGELAALRQYAREWRRRSEGRPEQDGASRAAEASVLDDAG